MHRSRHIARRSALGLLASAPFAAPQRATAVTPAERLQAQVLATAEFTDEHNTPHRLTELTSPILLVNLWAAWCPGCLEELPTIQALTTRLGPNKIDVLLLSHDMNWRADLVYARRAGLPFPHWKLSARVPETVTASVFRIEGDRFGLPQSLIFAGRRHILVESLEGSRDWSAPELVRLTRDWLDAAG